MPLVTAVVLNWNQPNETIACVDSLKQQTYSHLRCIVVDNGSNDDSVECIRQHHPDIQLLVNGRNAGFAGGMNPGIWQAVDQGAEWVFVVNNDTFFAPDMLETLIKHVDPAIGLLAPIIYYAAQPTTVWSLGGTIHSFLLEVITSHRGKIDNGQWPECLPVDFVPGCAMLLSKKVIEQVGVFDERFFMYYEDSDYCLRIRQAGYQIISITTAKMWHQVAVSSGGSDSANERYWMAHSSVRFFRKNGRFPQLLFIIPWRLGSSLRTTFRLAKNKNLSALTAYWRGIFDGLKMAQ